MRVRFVLPAVAAILASAMQGTFAAELCERELVPYDTMLSRLLDEPGVERVRDAPTFTELGDSKRMLFWTLGKPDRDRRSAYLCRRVVREGDRIVIKLTAECVGTTFGCDALVSQILADQAKATANLRPR